MGAFAVNEGLTDIHQHVWSASVALTDIEGMIRFSPRMSDAEVREVLDGVPVVPTRGIQHTMAKAYSHLDPLAIFHEHIFEPPTTEAQRDAIARAWKSLVLARPGPFLRTRWQWFAELLQLDRDEERGESIWVGISGDGPELWRDDPPSWQLPLRVLALRIGTSWLVRPCLYLYIILALAPFWIRSRDPVLVAMALSTFTCMATLFLATPAATFRYLVWLVVVAYVLTVALVARRAADVSR